MTDREKAARPEDLTRAQVVRRQGDGTWLRVLDQPEFVSPDAG